MQLCSHVGTKYHTGLLHREFVSKDLYTKEWGKLLICLFVPQPVPYQV